MEPHDYHCKIIAARPPKKLVIFYNILEVYQKFILVIFAAALLVVCASATGSIKGYSWPNIKTVGHVDNIISDDRDNSVYITVNGDIFKYSRELKLLSSTETSTSSNAAYNETNHNIIQNKLLLILKKSDTKQDLLFSCWILKDNYLKCWLNKLNTLKTGTLLSWPNETKGFRIPPTENIIGLTNQIDLNELLIVTSKTYDDQVQETNSSSISIPYPPAIGRFKISKGAKSLVLESRSVLAHTVDPIGPSLFFQDYVYLFDFNHFTHFILNDIQKPQISDFQYNVRIARICNNDTDLFSYTEISLTCKDQKEIRAKHAYLDTTKKDTTLYVVFEPVIDPSTGAKKLPSSSSSLCSYSMKLIDDLFNRAVSDCNNGNSASNLLVKYHLNDSDDAPSCQRNPTSADDWCTSKTNPYIDGNSYRYNVYQDEYLSLSNMNSINFLYTTKQGPDLRDVIFIGTETGYLTKMSPEEDLFFTVDLNHNQVKNYKMGEKYNPKQKDHERKDARYTVNMRDIMVTSGNSLSRLDIDECYYYTSCRACLSTSDPMKCVWCGDTCSKRMECPVEKQSTESCPPIIESFSPLSGPISGSTKLRIMGQNFGLKGLLKVKLNEYDCLIENRLDEGDTIECSTPTVDRPLNATISIDVSDDSSYIYSKGSTTAEKTFLFLAPKVYGLYPKSGSVYGGTRLSIYGENLHAGSSRKIYVGDSDCDIDDIKSERISCITRQPNNSSKKNASEPHLLKVLIDGHEQTNLHRLDYSGLNLSPHFIYTSDANIAPMIINTTSPVMPGSPVAYEGVVEEEGLSYMFFIAIAAIFMMISLIVLYVIRNDKSFNLKIKIPTIFESSDDKKDDAKVSYRSPDPNSLDPINGLVKLNGSVMSSDYFCKPEQLEQDQPLMMNPLLDNETALILVQEKILINRNRLTLGHVLGSGQFGKVYKGFLKIEETGEHAAVAVKTLHSRSSWDEGVDNRAFLEEGLMMKDFEHENVLTLIGVTFDSNGLPMVITPFMLYGDLRSYISDEASSPTVKELIDFATQIAKGMAYLSNMKFVHRDLAARNCMLDENLSVKVADFGLSRDIYERDYYSSDNKKAKLPVKWMAIESLETCIYNTKTDVWSYGVVLWELMTRGVVPYPDVDNFDLFSYLKEGRRMLRPRYCPLILYKIMLSCWSENPANRPTFVELVERVSDVITQLKVAKDGQQRVSREATYCDVLK